MTNSPGRRDRRVLAIDTLSAEEAEDLLAALQRSQPSDAAAAFDSELDGP